jgi:hypothetical protein
VLEEIAMVEDTPDDIVFEMHNALLWGDHPFGYSILGTRPRRWKAWSWPTCGRSMTARTGRGTWWWRRPATSGTSSCSQVLA